MCGSVGLTSTGMRREVWCYARCRWPKRALSSIPSSPRMRPSSHQWRQRTIIGLLAAELLPSTGIQRTIRELRRGASVLIAAIKVHGALAPSLRYSFEDDYIFIRSSSIEPFHEIGAALKARALINVALVGEFIAVDRGWLDHQHRA